MKSPVLFVVFNRPDTTTQVFEAIRKAKPTKLYIAADGPRPHKNGEVDRCTEVRNFASKVDWPCEIFTLFQKENLGCKRGVSTAITWFFENEEEGIILEDDVVPHPDFFTYCDEMLAKYRDDQRVMMITGTNYLSNKNLDEPYFFSEHFTIWGWATWKRAWSLYDIDMRLWDTPRVRENLSYKFNNSYIWKHFRDTFDSLKVNYIDTWDIQWVFTCLINSGLCITPKVNLITNIGVEGTHSDVVTDSHFIKSESLDIKQLENYHPIVMINSNYDKALHELKSKPAQQRKTFFELLKKTGLYFVLRFFYRLFK